MGALRLTLAAAGAAAVLGVAPTTPVPGALAATPALIMGGTGNPTPDQAYLDAAIDTYVVPALGGAYTAVPTYTPEEGFGVLPGETMSIAESTRAGVPYLEAKIGEYPGEPVVVFGYSQSGAIGAIVKNKLAAFADANPDAPVPDVTFVVLSCGCRPNGALEYRLGDLYDSSVVDSRARTDTPFPTVNVAWQYDVGSDWPLYPVNLLAMANVVLGGLYVHGDYLPSPLGIDGFGNGGQSPSLAGVQGITAPGIDTTFYLMPTENLPLFGPLRTLGVPESLIDIVEPVVRVMVEWGYDRTIPPWEPTPFRLVPQIEPVVAATDLVEAVGEGIGNAVKVIAPPPAPQQSPPPPPPASPPPATRAGDGSVDTVATGDGGEDTPASNLDPDASPAPDAEAGTESPSRPPKVTDSEQNPSPSAVSAPAESSDAATPQPSRPPDRPTAGISSSADDHDACGC